MLVGPVTVVCLAGAVTFAFLRAHAEQQARRHRTIDDDDGPARRPRLTRPKPRYTDEGEEHLRRARRYRTFFFALGLGALAAAWMGI